MAVATPHSVLLRHPLLSLSSSLVRASRPATGRFVHTTGRKSSPQPQQLSLDGSREGSNGGNGGFSPRDRPPPPPLAILPLTAILRSYMVQMISSSPILLPPSLAITSFLANSHSALFNPDKNPLLHYPLKKTFYAQFCAGETPSDVRQTIHELKSLGLKGVILGYAKEVVLSDEEKANLTQTPDSDPVVQQETKAWADGTLETVQIAEPGDFVALKFTGAGRQALYNLAERLPPSPLLAKAIDDICDLAVARGIRLLFDAEQQSLQPGIDDWTMTYMRRYNTPERAVVYGTYQAYLKSTPATLAGHLRAARDEGFALGVKLVRGAYIGSDPRHLIHDTLEDTHAAYDGIAAALMTRTWMGPLPAKTKGEAFPQVSMVLASHNAETVRKGRALVESGAVKVDVAFGQLQGMADQLTCGLVCPLPGREKSAPAPGTPKVQAYKYLVWGSAGDCMKYLLRRAHENRDAVQRTRDGRDAMRHELWRRFKGLFGMA